MEWAKGLKDRVERTAGELKSQAATAFTPPDEQEGEGSAVSTSPEPPPENNSDKSAPRTPPPSTQGDTAADVLTRWPLPQST